VSEVDDTSIFRERPTEDYPCSHSWLPRSHKGFPPRQPIVATTCINPERSTHDNPERNSRKISEASKFASDQKTERKSTNKGDLMPSLLVRIWTFVVLVDRFLF
jgi:hypothetical protein